jgi:hypothetical protein
MYLNQLPHFDKLEYYLGPKKNRDNSFAFRLQLFGISEAFWWIVKSL